MLSGVWTYLIWIQSPHYYTLLTTVLKHYNTSYNLTVARRCYYISHSAQQRDAHFCLSCFLLFLKLSLSLAQTGLAPSECCDYRQKPPNLAHLSIFFLKSLFIEVLYISLSSSFSRWNRFLVVSLLHCFHFIMKENPISCGVKNQKKIRVHNLE